MLEAYFILFFPVFIGVAFLWMFETVLIFMVSLIRLITDSIASLIGGG